MHFGLGEATISAVRVLWPDGSFLRRFLTPELMRELDLFQHQAKGDKQVVTEIANDEGFEEVKNTLLRSVGMGSIPIIEVIDVDHGQSGTLLLRHDHEGRDLQLGYAERTLEHVHRLWGRAVVLETVLDGKQVELQFDDDGFSKKP